MRHRMRQILAIACTVSMTMQMSVFAAQGDKLSSDLYGSFPEDTPHTLAALAQGDENGDAVTREGLWTMNMIHHNPGLEPYESPYNNSEFLEEREIDGHVFFLYDCAQFGVLWDDFDILNGIELTEEEYWANPDDPEIKALNEKKVLPYGSKERIWEEKKKADIIDKYNKAEEAGRQVMFMMDTIAVPIHLKEMYQSEICSGNTIDIKKEKTKQVMDCMMEEMLREFPQIDGFTFRFGETYVGPRYGAGAPYHVGNNPMIDDSYHKEFVDHMAEWLYGEKCPDGKARELIYRNWGFGPFQKDPETYLKITDEIEPNEHLYLCIKHTNSDFARKCKFNPIIGIGRHQQIVEVQSAREYEGKGAFPNYIGEGVINGFEEYEHMYEEGDTAFQSLRDAINCENSLVKGVWTWDRGGGWNGPYLNGANGIVGENNPDIHNHEVVIQNGSELWCDLNTYVVTQWCKDTSKTDKYYAKQYATEILGMNEKDAESFYKLCILSARAVLLGKTGDKAGTGGNYWMRDNIVHGLGKQSSLINNKTAMAERAEGVALWEEMIAIAEGLDDSLYDVPLPDSTTSVKDYIITTCKYGYYFFNLIYQTIIAKGTKENGDKTGNYDTETIMNALAEYDRLWEEWEELYETADGCPSLFMKEDKHYDFLGYDSDGGFDAAIKYARPTLTVNKNRQIEVGEKISSKARYTFGNDLLYASDNPDVATVDEMGIVTGVAEGYAKITVSTKGTDPLKAVFMVNVVPDDGIGGPGGTPEVPTVETKFEQTFDSQSEVDRWKYTNNNGYAIWNEQDGNMILKGEEDDGKGDVILTLPEAITGEHLVYSADVRVSNQENDSLTLRGSNGEIIAQLDFGGPNVGNKLALNGQNGTNEVLPLVSYEANKLYHVEIGVNTNTKKFTVTVTDMESGKKLLNGPVYGFREQAEDLGQLMMGSRDGAVKPPILGGEMFIDNIKIEKINMPEEQEEEKQYKTVFQEDFSKDVSDQWIGGGTKTCKDGEMTLSNGIGGEATFALPTPIAGHAIITFKMKINNESDRAFFQPTNSDGKHITQVEFRGNKNDPKGQIVVYKGSDLPAIVPYQPNTFYDVAIDMDTRTREIKICVNGGKPVIVNGYKDEDANNTALAKLNLGIRDNAALTISDLKIVQEQEISVPLSEIVTRTDMSETVLKGGRLSLPAVPEGYEIRVTGTVPEKIFSANGVLINRPAEDMEVEVSFELRNLMDANQTPESLGAVKIPVRKGRQLVETTGVTLDESEMNLGQGDSVRLTAEISPENSDNKSVEWDSSDWRVASVSQDGLVTGISEGDAIITVRSRDHATLEAVCKVHVKPGVPVVGIVLDKTELEMIKGEKAQLTATASPSNASNPGIYWESTDKKVATVDRDGLVTAQGVGKAVITATTRSGGFKAECKVTVGKAKYQATVEGGVITAVDGEPCDNKTDMSIAANSNVTIVADEPEAGYLFAGWEVSPASVKVKDADAAETSFVMPESPVMIRARFVENVATAGNAIARSTASPSDWYAVADQASLDALLDDDEILTEKDWEYLEKGRDVDVILHFDRKEASYGSNDNAVEEMKELLEDDEKIAFFTKTSLSKKVEGLAAESLATASNAVEITVGIPSEFMGMDSYDMISWNENEGAFDMEFSLDPERNMVTFTGTVNGIYALAYIETVEIPDEDNPGTPVEPSDPVRPNHSGSSGSSSGAVSASGYMKTDAKRGRVHSINGIITGNGAGYSNWQQEQRKDGTVVWRFRYADGTFASGTMENRADGTVYEKILWELINGAWYAFGADGIAKSGMIYDEALGGCFYIDINTGMKTGWTSVDGIWYYFNPVSDGKKGIRLENTWIDGWYVDENGIWNGQQKQ